MKQIKIEKKFQLVFRCGARIDSYIPIHIFALNLKPQHRGGGLSRRYKYLFSSSPKEDCIVVYTYIAYTHIIHNNNIQHKSKV